MYSFHMSQPGLLKALKIRKTHISAKEVNFYQSIQQCPIFPQRLSLKFKHDSSPLQFHPINNDLCPSEKRRIFYPERSSILSNLVWGMLFWPF